MKTVKFIRLWFAFLLMLLAIISLSLSGTGCATSHPISKDLRQQAREVTFTQVRADPEGTRGTVVIWGGRIINVANEAHGSSIYIICLPTPKDGEPMAQGPSPGRFIATSPDFLDPQMLPQGRRITVAGPLNGILTGQLGRMPYPYPVLQIKELHVWPPKAGEDYPAYPYYGYGYGYYGADWNYWGWGWGPGWGWYGFYPWYYGAFYGGHVHSFHGGFHGSNGEFHGNAGEGEHESGGEFHGGGGGGGGWSGGGGFHGGGGGGGGHGR